MMLRLQTYDLVFTYKPGKEMHIADALTHRSQKPSTSHFCRDLETVNFVEDLPISESTLAKFQAETAKDESLQVLSQVIRSSWPTAVALVPSGAQPFFKHLVT